ncbi:MAG: DnaB-like helicase C-terminal domain-containing protein, partial [Bacteroidaceae bacterium]|nr:DnaB-like helicase C-terminal domain-containing protein [Bacteroidaceae bacterium]
DIVTFIHRPEYYHIYQDANGRDLRGKAEIIVAKHRNGEVGDVRLTFRGEYARFENMESGYVPVPGEKTVPQGGEIPAPMDIPLPEGGLPPLAMDDPLAPLPPGTDLGAF